ncbi:hypothetical protein L9F63_025107, partial [Diploptera punctata]
PKTEFSRLPFETFPDRWLMVDSTSNGRGRRKKQEIHITSIHCNSISALGLMKYHLNFVIKLSSTGISNCIKSETCFGSHK